MGDNGGQRSCKIRFRGRSEHSMDDKGRLNIPSRFQEVLRDLGDERLMVIPWNKCIKAYPVPVWEELEEKLIALIQVDADSRKMAEHMIGGVVECPVKQGRISLPQQMRDQIGMGRDVVVEGVMTTIKIWDKPTWERQNKPSEEDYSHFDQKLSLQGHF